MCQKNSVLFLILSRGGGGGFRGPYLRHPDADGYMQPFSIPYCQGGGGSGGPTLRHPDTDGYTQ